MMAGCIYLDYDPATKEFQDQWFGGDGKPIDRFDVDLRNLTMSREAAHALIDYITALLMG